MTIRLPREVNNIIDILHRHGHEAYAVGGAVRDVCLGREPKDWDVTTSALPEEIKSIFHKTFDTGIEHGTVTVLMSGKGYEVTTYRIDGKYLDSRHPKSVTYTSNLKEDLLRRDFTINAMAYNNEEGLIDEFGGLKDLNDKIIRTVGSAKERFGEDALRMLRALRFSAQLGFSVDEETLDAISALSYTIEAISYERIRDELVQLIISDNPGKLVDMYNLGLTRHFLPEFDDIMDCEQHSKHHMYTVGMHTVVAMEHTPPDKIYRLTMLLHDMGKVSCKTRGEDGFDHFYNHPKVSCDIASNVLKRLKFDNKTISSVKRLVLYHDDRPSLSKKSVRRRISAIGQEAFPDLFIINRADTLAQSTYNRDKKLKYIDEYEKIYNEIITEQSPLKISDLKISGRDLIDIGIDKGPRIGEILGMLLDDVLDEPAHNDRDYLIELAVTISGMGQTT